MCEPAKAASLPAAALTVVLASQVVASAAEAIALGVFAACAVTALAVAWKMGWLAALRAAVQSAGKVRGDVRQVTARTRAVAEIAAPRRAIAAPRVVQGEVLGSYEDPFPRALSGMLGKKEAS